MKLKRYLKQESKTELMQYSRKEIKIQLNLVLNTNKSIN